MVTSRRRATPAWTKVGEIQASSGDELWTISRKADGTFGCSCPRWRFQRGIRTDCKHIAFFRRKLAAEAQGRSPFQKAPALPPAPVSERTAAQALGAFVERKEAADAAAAVTLLRSLGYAVAFPVAAAPASAIRRFRLDDDEA